MYDTCLWSDVDGIKLGYLIWKNSFPHVTGFNQPERKDNKCPWCGKEVEFHESEYDE